MANNSSEFLHRESEMLDNPVSRLRKLTEYADAQFHRISRVFNGESETTEQIEPHEVEDAHTVYLTLTTMDPINLPQGKTYENFLAETRQEREDFDELLNNL